jgi:hypothetical protein
VSPLVLVISTSEHDVSLLYLLPFTVLCTQNVLLPFFT